MGGCELKPEEVRKQIGTVFENKLIWIEFYALNEATASLKEAWSSVRLDVADDPIFSELVKDSIVSGTQDGSKPLLDWLMDKSINPFMISTIFTIIGVLRHMRGWAQYTMSNKQTTQHQIQLCRIALNKLNKCLDIIWR